jgi:hypothetical protein
MSTTCMGSVHLGRDANPPGHRGHYAEAWVLYHDQEHDTDPVGLCRECADADLAADLGREVDLADWMSTEPCQHTQTRVLYQRGPRSEGSPFLPSARRCVACLALLDGTE